MRIRGGLCFGSVRGCWRGFRRGEQDLCGCFSGRRDCAYHFPVHYEEILKNLLVKTAMTEIPDLEGGGGGSGCLIRRS